MHYQFLEIIIEYCKEKNLFSLIHEKPPKRERKTEEDKNHTRVSGEFATLARK